ncbi:HlyD family efflux transporter periplasmic adaptor subunit [Thalassococcus lentus]|uniref:HlyD family efflux transporter periplasmic adaptor subunit n=1 Tax=Thalassococcus lentus TaxID=1210524 RepID=A0ABT4XW80_9RHOB|nr:HlyD family efflux transporter periplasmic adaptor subunit [Thalassococcus lentus]MDA7426231.1 HlyD family efflux transporter periplasmic adaptor subunit [Thalassococcus lentus]
MHVTARTVSRTALALALCIGTAQTAFSQVRTTPDGNTIYLGTVRASNMHALSYGARGCIQTLSEEAKRAQMAQAGQELVRLDDQSAVLAMRTAEARVLDLEAALAERQLAVDAAVADDVRRKKELDFVGDEFKRNSTLFRRGLINETTLEGVERRIMDAEFAAERAQEAIASARSAKTRAEIALEIGKLDLQAAENTLQDLFLTTPFDGVLVNFDENVGDCVQEGELAAQIYAPHEKAVDIFVPISELSDETERGISLGAEVTILRSNGATCSGLVTRVDTEADLESQFVSASIDIAQECAPDLFLNEAVEVGVGLDRADAGEGLGYPARDHAAADQ